MDYSNNSGNSSKQIPAYKIREEDEAYFKLCQIINNAIQAKDPKVLDAEITSWLIEYDVDSFVCQNYKAKIKSLLSEISQIRAFIETLIIKNPPFDLSRAYEKLCVIVRDTNDIKELKSKIKTWKEKYPPEKFSDYFKSKIKRITCDDHLKRVAFDQQKAYNELQEILKFSDELYIEELSPKIEEWKKTFNIDDFVNKYSSNVKSLTDNKYLDSIAKQRDSADDIENIVQENAYADFVKCLSNPRNVNGLFNWIYTYRTVSFNDTARNLLTREFLKYYNIPTNSEYKIPEFNSDHSLSYDNLKNLFSVKKDAIVNFFGIMLYGKSLPATNKANLDNLHSFSSCGIEVSLSSKGKIVKEEKIVSPIQETETTPIVYTVVEDDLFNLENIHSAVEQSNEIKKVDKLASFTLKEKPEIVSESIDVILEDNSIVDNDENSIPESQLLIEKENVSKNVEKKRTDIL